MSHRVDAETTRTLTGRIVWVGVCDTCGWTGKARQRDYQARQDAGQHAAKYDDPRDAWHVLDGQQALPMDF